MYFTKELKSLIVVLKNVYAAPNERKLHYPMTVLKKMLYLAIMDISP